MRAGSGLLFFGIRLRGMASSFAAKMVLVRCIIWWSISLVSRVIFIAGKFSVMCLWYFAQSACLLSWMVM